MNIHFGKNFQKSLYIKVLHISNRVSNSETRRKNPEIYAVMVYVTVYSHGFYPFLSVYAFAKNIIIDGGNFILSGKTEPQTKSPPDAGYCVLHGATSLYVNPTFLLPEGLSDIQKNQPDRFCRAGLGFILRWFPELRERRAQRQVPERTLRFLPPFPRPASVLPRP